jgi:hypothetical protein
MTPTYPLPRSLEDVTPAWLTARLRENGALTEASITGLDFEHIGAEVGFLDGLARLRLTYDRVECDAPPAVVVKLPASDPRYRRIGDFYHAYEREIRFYREVAPRAPLRLPRCFYAGLQRDSDWYLLVLEDMSGYSPGDQVRGLSAAQACAAVQAMGAFHASWWNTSALAELEWMPRRNLHASHYRAAWPKFREVVGPRLAPEALARGEELNACIDDWLDRIDAMPATIVHADFRADNLLFDDRTPSPSVVVLDWQLAIRSAGMLDVARLLCGSVPVEDRRACAHDALRVWHDALLSGGVRGYSFDQAIADYRLCALVSLYYPVTIHDAEEAAGARGSALAHAQIERFFAASAQG